jgi:two-component system, NarL family, nitrate/nitrite response regulator NarL
MAILLVTRDCDLEDRCRRATSAHYSIVVIDSVNDVAANTAATPMEVVLIDAETLQRPYADKVAHIVTTPGVGRVVVMTAEYIEDEEVALLRCGVQGCCRRGIDATSLNEVLGATKNGVWVTSSLLPRLVSELRRYAQHTSVTPLAATLASETGPRAATEKLSNLVKLLADGATNKQVAQELDISERTVKGHLSNVFMKLGVSDRLNLVLFLKGGRQPLSESRK